MIHADRLEAGFGSGLRVRVSIILMASWPEEELGRISHT